MIIFLRVTAFLFTLIAAVAFVALNGNFKVISETKDALIQELEQIEPNQERIEDMKEYVAVIDDSFNSVYYTLAGVLSIILSFAFSTLSKRLRNQKHIKSVLTTPGAARPTS